MMIVSGSLIDAMQYPLLLLELAQHLRVLKQCVKDIEQDVQILVVQHPQLLAL